MKNIILVISLIFLPLLSSAQEANIFPIGDKAPNVHHTGDVWLNHVFNADDTFDFNIAQAVSAEGSKLNWHLHPKGQLLLITKGVGFYQEKGKEVKIVRAGDVVKCLPEVEHWHGATPNNPVTYIAISGNAPTKWTDTLTAETYNDIKVPEQTKTGTKEHILELSQKKWDWMADKNADSLAVLFNDKAEFVHMGGSWGTDRELAVIKSGGIWYKKADVHKVSAEIIGNTAIVLSNITLLAVVGGNEVSHDFIVTEVYVKEGGTWELANLSFVNQLSGPPGEH